MAARHVVANLMPELDADFSQTSLFYASPLVVCRNLGGVQEAAQLLATACVQQTLASSGPPDTNETSSILEQEMAVVKGQ